MQQDVDTLQSTYTKPDLNDEPVYFEKETHKSDDTLGYFLITVSDATERQHCFMCPYIQWTDAGGQVAQLPTHTEGWNLAYFAFTSRFYGPSVTCTAYMVESSCAPHSGDLRGQSQQQRGRPAPQQIQVNAATVTHSPA